MPDQLLIYAIVAFNIAVQLMLIRRLRFPPGGRRWYYTCSAGIPLAVIAAMRLAVAAGWIEGRVAAQSGLEQFVTTAAGLVLMGGPWLVTLAAILDRKRRAWIAQNRAE